MIYNLYIDIYRSQRPRGTFTKLAVGKSKVLHNCLKYVPLDCIKNIPHKVSVSSCCLKCSYFPVLRFILRLESMLNKVPEKYRLEMI